MEPLASPVVGAVVTWPSILGGAGAAEANQVFAHAYNFGLCLLQLAAEFDELASHIVELSLLADEHGLGAYEPQARFYPAWLAVIRDRDRHAVQPMRNFLDSRAAMGSLFLHSYFLMLLAGALLEAGEPDSALATLNEARSVAERTGERLWTAELERLWMHQNRRAEAYEHLAPAYGAFPEGFDTRPRVSPVPAR